MFYSREVPLEAWLRLQATGLSWCPAGPTSNVQGVSEGTFHPGWPRASRAGLPGQAVRPRSGQTLSEAETGPGLSALPLSLVTLGSWTQVSSPHFPASSNKVTSPGQWGASEGGVCKLGNRPLKEGLPFPSAETHCDCYSRLDCWWQLPGEDRRAPRRQRPRALTPPVWT